MQLSADLPIILLLVLLNNPRYNWFWTFIVKGKIIFVLLFRFTFNLELCIKLFDLYMYLLFLHYWIEYVLSYCFIHCFDNGTIFRSSIWQDQGVQLCKGLFWNITVTCTIFKLADVFLNECTDLLNNPPKISIYLLKSIF